MNVDVVKLSLYESQSHLRSLEKMANDKKDLAYLVEIYRIKKNVESALEELERGSGDDKV